MGKARDKDRELTKLRRELADVRIFDRLSIAEIEAKLSDPSTPDHELTALRRRLEKLKPSVANGSICNLKMGPNGTPVPIRQEEKPNA